MNPTVKKVHIESLLAELKSTLAEGTHRIGMLTSIDGGQIAVLVLDTLRGTAELLVSEVFNNKYTSLTLALPQVHWCERIVWDMFGILPEHHPRLNPVILQDAYEPGVHPLRKVEYKPDDARLDDREFHFLEVRGDSVWQLPVGPIHAGVIEPGHFRFSCMGEYIQNLQLKFGYVHRGVEKRLTEVPWKRANFVAEAIAGDTTAANALAHAVAIESLCSVEAPIRAQALRTLALEIERVAMHILDFGGMAGDLGMVGINQSCSRLRGVALGLGDAVSGSRFFKHYIVPGGVRSDLRLPVSKMVFTVQWLRQELKTLFALMLDNQSAIDRMDGIIKLKNSLAAEFGMVGVTGRACGLAYDTRKHFKQGLFPRLDFKMALEDGGDILSRTRIRAEEAFASLDVLESVLGNMPPGEYRATLPEKLKSDAVAVGIVEAFRGELIHLVFTDSAGNIKRYAVKDPSWNNWTAISIAVRNNLIADFPLGNKSLALSYSGNDL